MILLVLVPAAQAATMGLHGDVEDSAGDGAYGDLRVLIYDQASGGTEVYDETFTGAISNGSYAVMLGNSTPLNLSYGTDYYLDMWVNGEDLDFDGAPRRKFTSNVGVISSLQDISIDNLSVVNNASLPVLCLNDDCRTSWPLDTDTQKGVSGPYLRNDSTTIYFNESLLNSTIDARASSGSGKNGSGIYLLNNETTMYLNETRLNATISDLATGVSGGWNNGSVWTNTSLNVNVSGNVTTSALCLDGVCQSSWPAITDTQKNVSGPYLSNTSTTIYFNETLLNQTINERILADGNDGWTNDSVNTTTSLNVVGQNNLSITGTGFFGWLGTLSQRITALFAQAVHVEEVNVTGNLTLNGQAITDWSDVNVSGTDTQKNVSGPYLWNTSSTIYFNESLLNLTIDERSSAKNGSGLYIWNDNTTMYLNETRLNATIIDNIPVDHDGGWGNTSTVTNTTLDVLIGGNLNVTGNATIGEVLGLIPSTTQPTCSAGAVIMYNNSATVYPCYCNGTAWVRFENNSATC